MLLQGVSSSNWTQLLMAEARSGVGCTGLPGGEAASEMSPNLVQNSIVLASQLGRFIEKIYLTGLWQCMSLLPALGGEKQVD